jgi:CheY-like chemotaxis protein
LIRLECVRNVGIAQKKSMIFPKTLVAEDDPNDALLLQNAFKRTGISATIHFVSDGVEAIDYLRGKQIFEKVASSTLPGLLVLDLDMPRLGGFGVLEWLRMHPHLRPVRVVILSGSENPEDSVRAAGLGADHYLPKPSCHRELIELVGLLQASFSRGLAAQPLAGPTRRAAALALP